MTVQATDLRKRYGDFELSIADLQIDSGQTFGLVGNNGAGKTTFLRLVLDLIRPDGGRVLVGGDNVAETFDWKKRTGSYLDESFLIDFFTPDEFFHFTGSVYDLSDAEIDARLEAYRSFYTDEPIGETSKYIRDLSQGNRKKVGLIAALHVRPDLLILDEPFASLDPRSQIWLKEHLSALNEAHGITMIVSSHDLGHVTDVCERIAILEDGAIARDERTTAGTLDDLKRYFAREIRPMESGE